MLLLLLAASLAQDATEEVPAVPEPIAGDPAPTVDLVLRNARLVDAWGERVADLAITDGVIADLAEGLVVVTDQELDLAGRTVTPGLIDSHTHVSFAAGSGLFDWDETTHDDLVQHGLRAYVAAGVTTVLDCGSVDAELARVQAYLETGAGPRLLHLGEPPAPSGTYIPAVLPELGSQDTPEQLAAHVAGLAATGSTGIKVAFEDGVVKPLWPLPSADWLEALRTSADAEGLQVYAHAMSPEETLAALAVRPHALVHGLWEPDETAVTAVAAQDPYVIATMHIGVSALYPHRPDWQADPLRAQLGHPTLLANQADPEVREAMALAVGDLATPRLPAWLVKRLAGSERYATGIYADRVEATAMLHQAGVKLVVGSDAPGWPVLIDNLPAWSTIRELELLHEAGLTPEEVLAAATRVPAEMLGRADELGRIAIGHVGDLVVMTGDPLTDVGAWRTVTHVVRAGVVRTPTEWLAE